MNNEITIEYKSVSHRTGANSTTDYRVETFVNNEYKPELYTVDKIERFAQEQENRGFNVEIKEL